MSVERIIPPESREIPKILRIGVDLDDTVVEYGNVYFRAIKAGLKVYIPKLYSSFSGKVRELPEIASFPCGTSFLAELVARKYFYKIAKPIPNAIETLNKWRDQGHEIWFVTARWPNLSDVTFELMEKYGIGWAIERTFFKQNPNESSGEYKNRICQQLAFDVVLEDMVDVLMAINAPSVRLKIGLRRLWNTENYKEGKDGYLLVPDWLQMAQEVEKLLV